jgi:hypothetical protein
VAIIGHHQIQSASPTVGFEQEGWTRYLTINGVRSFEIGWKCDTCFFLFTRLKSERLSPEGVGERLRSAKKLLGADLLETIDPLLPTGDYAVIDMTIQPTLTRACLPDDYFCHESLDLFGIDLASGVPHSPQTPYWRAGSSPLPENSGGYSRPNGKFAPRERNPKQFMHFIVPMAPPVQFERDRVAEYRREFDQGASAAALGVSVLEVRGPAVEPWDKGDDPNFVFAEHWCLTTYLLDGHHKMLAASESGVPLRLLTFLARDASMASSKDVDDLLSYLDRAEVGREKQ